MDADGFVPVVSRRRRSHRAREQAQYSFNQNICAYETKEVREHLASHLRGYERSNKEFYRNVERGLLRLGARKGMSVLSLGLGSIHSFTNHNSRMQLALLIKLRNALVFDIVFAFDPAFSKPDLNLLADYGIRGYSDFFLADCSPTFKIHDNIFVMMPHCVDQVTEQVFSACTKWSPKLLLILGNKIPERRLQTHKVERHKLNLKFRSKDKERFSKSRLYPAFNDSYIYSISFKV